MGCQGYVHIDDYLTFSVCTHDPDTGVLTDADSNPEYRVYEDETAVPILIGTMDILDDVNTTGFYTERIACTAANGFEIGKSYTIYIEATVDGDTGGICYGFSVASSASAADVWAYIPRTLTQPAMSVVAAVVGSDIVVSSYSTWSITLTGLGNISARTKLYFTAKDHPETDPDTASIVQVEEGAGLLYVNGTVGTPAHGSIVVADAVAGDITVTVAAAATGIPREREAWYAVKMVTASGVYYMCEGNFTVQALPGRVVT